MQNTLIPTFSNILKLWMNKNQMSQMELSRKSGIPQPMISRILSGKWKNLTIQTIHKISAAFGKMPRIEFDNFTVCKTIESASPPRSAACFWDVEIASIHLPEHAYFVTERILNFGSRKEIKWLLKNVSADAIREVITTSKSLSPKSRSFWSLFFSLKSQHV